MDIKFRPGSAGRLNTNFPYNYNDEDKDSQLNQPPPPVMPGEIARSSGSNLEKTPTKIVVADEIQNQPAPKVILSKTVMEDFEMDQPCCCGLGCCGAIVFFISIIGMIALLPIMIFLAFGTILQYERGIVFRFGRIASRSVKEPGPYFVNPFTDKVIKVDLRTKTYDIPPQEILTRDSVTVSVDAVVYYKVFEPLAAINNVENFQASTQMLAQTALRNVLGLRDLSELIGQRDSIANDIQRGLDEATDPWGIKVERVEIKDVRLPFEMQRAMAAEAEAAREARAKVFAAEGEMKAALSFREASDVMSQSPFALQLRYLQTLQVVSSEKNRTYLFPLPLELMEHLTGGDGRGSRSKSKHSK